MVRSFSIDQFFKLRVQTTDPIFVKREHCNPVKNPEELPLQICSEF